MGINVIEIIFYKDECPIYGYFSTIKMNKLPIHLPLPLITTCFFRLSPLELSPLNCGCTNRFADSAISVTIRKCPLDIVLDGLLHMQWPIHPHYRTRTFELTIYQESPHACVCILHVTSSFSRNRCNSSRCSAIVRC